MINALTTVAPRKFKQIYNLILQSVLQRLIFRFYRCTTIIRSAVEKAKFHQHGLGYILYSIYIFQGWLLSLTLCSGLVQSQNYYLLL